MPVPEGDSYSNSGADSHSLTCPGTFYSGITVDSRTCAKRQ